MSEEKLDQIVKGAPPPDAKIPAPEKVLAALPPSLAITDHGDGQTPSIADPLATVPSSAPQIYLNLLILEASLRSQYLTLRARRRQHTFFLLLLGLWIINFFYVLFLRPREDGRGLGGSVYWVVETAEKVALMGGIMTAILVWGTGQWERGIRWPRRWLGVANRGLRVVNAKVVVIKGPWWSEALSMITFLFPASSLFSSSASSYYCVNHPVSPASERMGQVVGPRSSGQRGPDDVLISEEELSTGGDLIKLLLLPKVFSPDFRENWELYRTEYWEKENERRANLRRQIRQRHREIARQQRGWFWWIGWRSFKGVHHLSGKRDGDRASHVQPHHHHSHHSHHQHHLSRQHSEKELKHRSKGSSHSGSYSGTSSRSSTPTRELDDGSAREHVRRRSSNAGNAGGRPKKLRQDSITSNPRHSKRPSSDLRTSSASRPDARPAPKRSDSFRTSPSGGESD